MLAQIFQKIINIRNFAPIYYDPISHRLREPHVENRN